jgi:two-component system invasion response regulator UvrY
MDGLEASRRIKAAYPQVAVLLLSTYDPEDFAQRIPGSGAIAFIPKAAFGPDRLTEAWDRAASAK